MIKEGRCLTCGHLPTEQEEENFLKDYLKNYERVKVFKQAYAWVEKGNENNFTSEWNWGKKNRGIGKQK